MIKDKSPEMYIITRLNGIRIPTSGRPKFTILGEIGKSVLFTGKCSAAL